MMRAALLIIALAAALPAYHHITYVAYPHTRAQPVTRNWDGHYTFAPPDGVALPASTEEVVALMAFTTGPVKVVGSGHSWNDIAVPVGRQISLDKMNKVLSFDLENKRVTVEVSAQTPFLMPTLFAWC